MLNQQPLNRIRFRLILGVIIGLLLGGNQVMAEERLVKKQESLLADTEIGGVLMLDSSLYDGSYRLDPSEDHETKTELRRARISLKHRLNKDWQAKLQLNFDEEESSVEIGDAYIRYKGLKGIELKLGQMKEPFGLERLGSSKNTTFLERSMVTSALAPGRNKGVMLTGLYRDFTWSLGGYDVDAEEENAHPYALTGRLSWAPVRTDAQTLHLGLAGSWRDLDEDRYEIKEPAEVQAAEEIINSSKIATDRLWLMGLEAAWINGPFSVQGEYMRADLQAVDKSEDATIDGYYLQAGYFLSGESRRYKKGVFKKVKPLSPSGAWEFAARYSNLDSLELKRGEKGKTTTIGINYYFNEQVKVMANLLHSEVSYEEDGNAISVRLQYVF